MGQKMVALDEALAKKHRQQMAMKEFEAQLRSAREMPHDDHLLKFYEFAGQTIGRDNPIRYLEFGVFDGTSMSKMRRVFSNIGSEFVGFDSFEGLPESWGDFAPGKFSREGALPYNNDGRVRFVKGWFQNTLPGYLAGLRAQQNDQPTQTLVHYDADLYSSTLFILTCLWLDIPEYYFIFDEFFMDEVVALQDFASAFPVKLEFFAKTGGPMQVFGKLTRTELTLG
jgi:O-methyltransferase